MDLSNVDFERHLVEIKAAQFTQYPNRLLGAQADGAPGDDPTAPYGTRRLRLRLAPNQIYALCLTCPDFAFRVLVNGQEIGAVGSVGHTPETSRALAGALLCAFASGDGAVELSIQYSGFVRNYGPPGAFLGSVEQLAAQQQRLVFRDVLFAGCILFLRPVVFTGRLGLFLIFAGVVVLYVAARLLLHARNLHAEQGLILIAALLLSGVSLAEQSVLRWVLPYWYGNGFLSATAMIGAIFLNVIALSLYAFRIEAELGEARRLEQSLRQSNRSLDRLNRLQRAFLQTVSHELRTPLAVMSGHAQLSAKKLRAQMPAEDIPGHLDVITREAQRLSELVSGLLSRDAFPPEAGDAGCDAAAVARHCAALFEPLLAKAKNKARLSLAKALPDVAIDGASLTQILLNLLTNANRHTRQGTIELGAKAQAQTVLLWVADDGDGMEPALLATAFQRQVRGGPDGRHGGLGLSICREMVEAGGGRMGLESTPGQGTRVWLTLPILRKGERDDD